MWILYIVIAFAILGGFGTLADVIKKNRTTFSKELEAQAAKIEAAFSRERKRLDEQREALEILRNEKCEGFPWLAKAYADFCELQGMEEANEIEHKSHPAPKAAETVRAAARRRAAAERAFRVCRYKLEFYEELFPWLVEFQGEDIDDLIRQATQPSETADSGRDAEEDDPVRRWLTKAEFEGLSGRERNQLALDRYWLKRKSKWEIGRDFERYIGHIYEANGWEVRYQGIIEGLSDLGRDLICRKQDKVAIIQCKFWSAEKQIHEKHVFQLFGTKTAFCIENPQYDVAAFLITSTKLSERAREFAENLKIGVTEETPFERNYPCIKCNVSHKDGTKIYHLPFDQQYDRTLIDRERNECYVGTVAEAESLGFRRAFRWRGAMAATTAGATNA